MRITFDTADLNVGISLFRKGDGVTAALMVEGAIIGIADVPAGWLELPAGDITLQLNDPLAYEQEENRRDRSEA